MLALAAWDTEGLRGRIAEGSPTPSLRQLLQTCSLHQRVLGHICGDHNLDHLLQGHVLGQRGKGTVHEVIHSHWVGAVGRGRHPSGPGMERCWPLGQGRVILRCLTGRDLCFSRMGLQGPIGSTSVVRSCANAANCSSCCGGPQP